MICLKYSGQKSKTFQYVTKLKPGVLIVHGSHCIKIFNKRMLFLLPGKCSTIKGLSTPSDVTVVSSAMKSYELQVHDWYS
jgi:hypothetical protein